MKQLLIGLFIMICLMTISQNAFGQQTCNSNVWTEKIIDVGNPNTYVDFLAASVILDIRDGNGKSTSTGSYLHITNYGDQPIEWVTYGNSPYYPVSAGGEDEKLLAIYRSANDYTPTKVKVVVRYKCNTKAGQRPQQSTSSQNTNNQSSNNQAQQTTNSSTGSANQPFPTGCWKFTYVDYNDGSDYSNVVYQVFREDGAKFDLTVSKAGKLIDWSKLFWKLRGTEITTLKDYGDGKLIDIESPLRSDGTRLRGWFYNDKGDVPSNMRYYGVKDDGCEPFITEMKRQGGKW